MTIAEDIFFLPFQLCLLQYVLAKVKRFYILSICMSYDANASMCNLKLIYPFIILFVLLCNMS